jgi:hypothetical protein
MYAVLLQWLTHLVSSVQPRATEQQRCCGVHQAVDVIVQVGHHVVHAEGGCDDAVHYQIFLRCRKRREVSRSERTEWEK